MANNFREQAKRDLKEWSRTVFAAAMDNAFAAALSLNVDEKIIQCPNCHNDIRVSESSNSADDSLEGGE